MLCQKCNHNQANTIISQTINGYTNEMYLCSRCARENKYLTSKKINEFDDFFAGFPLGSLVSGIIKPALKTAKCCPQCGSSFEEISQRGRMGCAACYTTFENELSETILKLHGKASHLGKMPKQIKQNLIDKEVSDDSNTQKDENSKKSLIVDLREKLRVCIEKEEFETAAQYRDKLKEIEADSAD